MQLIPSLDLYQGRLVRLRHGDPKQATFYDLTPEGWIRQLADAGARRIHLVDLDGAFGQPRQGRFASLPLLFPELHFQVGGGLRDRAAIDEVLARVDALTSEDIHEAARHRVASPRTLSVVGPFDESDFDASALSLG